MGKVIVITGAGDGLGRALARRFAKDGETVILLGRTLSKVEAVANEIGAPHVAIECDVANPQSVEAAFAQIAKSFDHIDVLINNAGIYTPFNLSEAVPSTVQDIININFAGPVYCSQQALPLLQKAGGQILNVTSESSHIKIPMLWLYASSKAAVELMGDMWAQELTPLGVRVTSVRAGQMYDETKTGSGWPMDVSIRFGEACAKVGLNPRERGVTHYNNVTDAFRSIIDMPADLHMGLVTLTARKPVSA